MTEYDVFDVACLSCGNSTFGVLLKPETLNRMFCPECKTPSYVYVSNNLSILTFKEEEMCGSCKGSGKCQECMGSGIAECLNCNGNGYYYFDGDDTPSGCHKCGGNGMSDGVTIIDENVLLGSGKADCTACSGTGICSACQGNRFVTK